MKSMLEGGPMSERRISIPWITVILIGINLILYGLETITGGSESNRVAIRFGAQYLPLVLQGEYWRVFTSMFLHFGWDHLAGNMFSLFIIGQIVEPYYGRIRFLLLYLISGIGGNLLSLFMDMGSTEPAISAGASGAIFGIMAAFLIFALDSQMRRAFPLPRVLLGLILSLAPGFYSSGINLFAHLGGFAVGLLMAFLLKLTLPRDRILMEEYEEFEE